MIGLYGMSVTLTMRTFVDALRESLAATSSRIAAASLADRLATRSAVSAAADSLMATRIAEGFSTTTRCVTAHAPTLANITSASVPRTNCIFMFMTFSLAPDRRIGGDPPI